MSVKTKKESTWERRARLCREKKSGAPSPARIPARKRSRTAPLAIESETISMAADVDEAPIAPAASGPIVLDENLHHSAAAPLWRQLMERRGQAAVIDASRVRRLGAQCLQVLLSASKHWASEKLPFSLVGCSTAMGEDLRLLGFEPNSFSVPAQ